VVWFLVFTIVVVFGFALGWVMLLVVFMVDIYSLHLLVVAGVFILCLWCYVVCTMIVTSHAFGGVVGCEDLGQVEFVVAYILHLT